MIIPDVNVLVYAVNSSSPNHSSARAWVEDAMSATRTIGLSWLALMGFLRITTNEKALAKPLTVAQAESSMQAWLNAGPAAIIDPGVGHLERVCALLGAVGTAGNLVTDAHLAALAQEYDADVATYDRDFARFPGVRWFVP